ncbi:UNVERIFIED_CONTAM: hypothetical protein K2H54_060851 [Gekko kuhli]
MNACLHTQTQKLGKGGKHTQSFVSSNVGTYQTVPMEKKERKRKRSKHLKSVAKRKIVQENTGTKLHICLPWLQMWFSSVQENVEIKHNNFKMKAYLMLCCCSGFSNTKTYSILCMKSFFGGGGINERPSSFLIQHASFVSGKNYTYMLILKSYCSFMIQHCENGILRWLRF